MRSSFELLMNKGFALALKTGGPTSMSYLAEIVLKSRSLVRNLYSETKTAEDSCNLKTTLRRK